MDSPVKDAYSSISAPAEGLFKDNGSRFIALAWPVETQQQIKDIVDSLKKEYHDARHHCYAWRLGWQGQEFRANDDGEPSGSAGRPILGQIDSPGLIRAYKTSTADALDHATVVEKVAGTWYTLDFGYLSMNPVMKVVKDLDLPQQGQDFGERCRLQVRVRLSLDADFRDRIAHIEDCTLYNE